RGDGPRDLAGCRGAAARRGPPQHGRGPGRRGPGFDPARGSGARGRRDRVGSRGGWSGAAKGAPRGPGRAGLTVGILERIVQAKRAEVEHEKERLPMRRAIELASAAPPPQDFAAALRRPSRINVIAEVKRASPSRGPIREGADPSDVARAYGAAGAAAISVLTDARFFLGAPEHLAAVRQAVDRPLLRKDFLFDEYQIYRSRALGADAVLLIARILPMQ